MFKKLLLLLLIVAPLSVFSQNKIAYLNAQEVFAKMPELKEVESKIATKKEGIQKSVTAIEGEFTNLQKKWDALPENASETERTDLQKQLEQLQERYQNFMQQSQAELQKEQEALIAPLQQKLMQAIKDVGDENNFTFILDSAAIQHTGSGSTDATPLVKSKLGIKD